MSFKRSQIQSLMERLLDVSFGRGRNWPVQGVSCHSLAMSFIVICVVVVIFIDVHENNLLETYLWTVLMKLV